MPPSPTSSVRPVEPVTCGSSNDICIVGGGPAGLAAALAIAAKGRDVTLLAADLDERPRDIHSHRQAGARDTRTTAILGDSMTLLANLGVWPALAPCSASLAAIRIVDDRGGWLKAPEVLFPASELQLPALGANVPNDALVDAMLARAERHPRITLVPTRGVTAVTASSETVTLATPEGKHFSARLVVAADGRKSMARAAAGITTRTWSYDQVAVATSFGHGRPHQGVSTELHARPGPLTTVPLPDDATGPCSSLVWIETPARAQHLMTLPDANFATELERRLHDLLGRVSWIGRRATFPIRGMMAVGAARNRIALVGEAAHVVPPIGAQGLNLGFRDAAALADAICEHGADDPGDPAVIDSYVRSRAADLVSREVGIDLLNRSLLSNFPAVQAVRGLGLHALANSAALRKAVMRMGMSAPGEAPSLMRPLANMASRA